MGVWGRCVNAAMLGLVAVPSSGAVIDDFEQGALSQIEELNEVQLDQTGLDPLAVAGAGRRIDVFYGGEFSVGQTSGPSAGQLVLDHDRGIFEAAQIRYGAFADGLSPINGDFTDGGASDRLLIRVSASAPASTGQPQMSITISSGVDEGVSGFGGAGVRLPTSSDPYVLSIPFDTLVGDTDFTDVDGLSISFFLHDGGRIVLDAIETGSVVVGDLDANGLIEAADFASFDRFYGVAAPLTADANDDGTVDAADYTLWRDQLAAAAVATPEPSSLAALAVACLSRAGLSRRSR